MSVLRVFSFLVLFILFVLLGVLNSYSEETALEKAMVLNQHVVKLHEQGLYAEAVPMAEQALKIREEILGREHVDVAHALNNLGLLHNSLGDKDRAESLYMRALQIFEKTLGPQHPNVAEIKNNLANLYLFRGEYPRSESLYKEAREIFHINYGSDHPRAAKMENNLGMLYYSMGDYDEAERHFKCALAKAEKALGPEHACVERISDNLIDLYQFTGDYIKADLLRNADSRPWKNDLGPFESEMPTNEEIEKEPIKAVKKEPENGLAPKTEPLPEKEAPVLQYRPAHGEGLMPESSGTSGKAPAYIYSLHLGSFRTLSRAEKAIVEYERKRLPAYCVKVDLKEKGIWHRVFTGSFAERKQAEAFGREHGLTEAKVKRIRFAGPANLPTSSYGNRQGPEKEKPGPEPQSSPEIETYVELAGSPEKTFSYPYSLFLGSFRTLKRANAAVSQYKEKGLTAYFAKVELGKKGTWYRVFTGYFSGTEEAERFKKKHGLTEAAIRKTRYANLIDIKPFAHDFEDRIASLRTLGYCPYSIRDSGGRHRLLVGAFLTKTGAVRHYEGLKSVGIENHVVNR